MHRIAKRIVILLVPGLLVGACISACATEDETYESTGAFQQGKCAKEFCPEAVSGERCCMPDNKCGVNMGMGCIATLQPDAS